MKRAITFIFTISIICLCSCRKHGNYHFKVTGLALYNQENSGRTPVDSGAAVLPAKSYCIRTEYSFVFNYKDDNIVAHESFNVIDNKITRFNIYSLTDFDSLHPAGASMNDCFMNTSRTDFFSGGTNASEDAHAVYQVSYSLPLMILPATGGYRQFVVDMTLDDTLHLSDTIAINLIK